MDGKVLVSGPHPDAEDLEKLRWQRRWPRIAGAVAIGGWAVGAGSQFIPGASSWNGYLFYPELMLFLVWFFHRLLRPSRSIPRRSEGDGRVVQVALSPANPTGPFFVTVAIFIAAGLALPNVLAAALILPPFIAVFWLMGRRWIVVQPDEVAIVNYLDLDILVASNIASIEFVEDGRWRPKSRIEIHLVIGEPVVLYKEWTFSKSMASQFVKDANVVLGLNEIQDAPEKPRPQDRVRS